MTVAETLEALVRGQDLGRAGARSLMSELMSGEVPQAQIAGVLVALRSKGVPADELAGFAEAMRERVVPVKAPEGSVDTCGTGGGSASFNLSTAAAIVASACGATVAKHGNKAVTSKCGSADVLQALGVELTGEPAKLESMLKTVGLAFLFAPYHHPAMKHVGPVRKELGIRTVFNLLGPLANPAGTQRQMIGVFDEALLVDIGQALKLLGTEAACVVHSKDGLDEVSPCAPTAVAVIGPESGGVAVQTISPSSFGLAPLDPSALTPGETLEESAAIVREAISDADSVRCLAVLPNVGVTLKLAGLADSFERGAAMARQAVADGKASDKLEMLIEASHL